MAKKGGRKIKSPIRRFFTIFTVMLASSLMYSSVKEMLTTMQLYQDIKTTEQELKTLQEKHKYLEGQKEKFNNTDYVKYYARGKYLLSKEGETIYKFQPNAGEEMENKEKK